MYAADLADANEDIAFSAFNALIQPALRAMTRTPLRRARHVNDPCRGPADGSWCADCEETLNDVLLDAFGCLTGDVVRTRAGGKVRELAMIVEHLRSLAARHEDVRHLSVVLTSGGELPPWLRAVRAQLVHYPTRHLEERVRRADAVARGGSARPERDLRTAAWAAPLRADPAALDILLAFIGRLRHRAPDPYAMPDDLLARHGLSPSEAVRRLDAALAWLGDVRPQFYADNVTAQLVPDALPDSVEHAGPEEHVLAAERTQAARAKLTKLMRASHTYPPVIAELCMTGDPLTRSQQELGLTPVAARRFVRRLALLVGAAGLVE